MVKELIALACSGNPTERGISLRWSRTSYRKTLNVSVPFISQISSAKQNREFEGHEYQLQAKMGQNYYSISNCMVLIRQNERRENNFAR